LNYILFLSFFISSFLLFFWSISKTDFRGMFVLLSMVSFYMCAFYALDIESHYVVEGLLYTTHDTYIEIAYLCSVMGSLALFFAFVKALTAVRLNKKKDRDLLDE